MSDFVFVWFVLIETYFSHNELIMMMMMMMKLVQLVHSIKLFSIQSFTTIDAKQCDDCKCDD